MNSSKNKVSRRNVRTGVAALSAITLALGSLSIFAPSELVSESTAATFTGGIRDKSGAVEKDAQKASDLPAGSCVVSENAPQGSQAGFSWNTSEPSATSPSKTRWGLSVSFDNSKDRTFADWYFTNTGNLGALLDTGEVPSMEAGQTFLDKSVTHKADESIVIDGARAQRNLNLNAEMTEEEVKQFASATADNPVRYAWQSNYKKDNPSGLRATQGPSSAFSATVNPWPSENIECNPITVSWENWEKHVIVPGDETKVGTVNIPAVQNDGEDDSMSRMVVEAYDGNGKFIGTTDPAVSGGTQNLRIDKNTGEIFFSWPEYRGTDLATDKNVSFSVLAKPRTVDQLQAAAHHNTNGEGKAFDGSNSLDRYSKANVIDSKAFSLDDTEYHDPKYDKTDAAIISGVDSATGPIATEPQKVTFTQTPDLIKELAKKKDQEGFEAKATLDEKYVFEGWTVEMDEDYNVTVTAPENPRPGTFARPVVTVEYSNGSTDRLELLVVVDPNNTQVTDLVRPGLSKGKLNEDITAQVGTKSIMKGHKPVHPAKFEIDESTVPDGWTVTVDDTGKVTAKADDSVAPGTVITPKVKATYPDQTTDEIEVQFQAIVDIKIPTYDTVTGQPKASVSLTPEIPERGLSGNTTDEAPTRYTFEDGSNKTTLTSKDGKTWDVYVDENTGEITTTIPKGAQEGDILNVPVQAHYSDQGKQKPQTVVGTVVVIKGEIEANYNVQTAAPGQEVKHQVEDAPDGSTFSFGRKDGKPVLTQEVNGWTYTIDPKTGEVSSTPPADAKPGDKNTITVTVNAPGGLTTQTPVTTVVKLTNKWEAEPSYPVQTVYPGDTATLPVALEKPDNVNVAKEKPYKLGDVPSGWNVSIDDNGQITATAPEDAKPGDQVKIPVTVTYEDGSTDTTHAVVNVLGVPEREIPFDVEYKYDDSIPAGKYEVQTKGKPGLEKQNKNGSWERTTEPVNEVVLVGTKPAESAKDVTWTVPIPYPTEVRENPDLKPGETRVVQEGENGEKTYTAKFTAKGDKAEVVEEETTKEPVKRIVEYGPGLAPSELVTKTEKPIPFETEVEFDPNLPAGEKVVDQKGELGTEVETSTQKLVDGKPSGDPTVTTERTKEPTTEKIRVGTKTTGENTETYKAEAPYKVVVKYDPNMPAGESKVTTPGVPGEKTVTIKRDIVNSKPGDPQITEEITKQPVDEVITVGTKPSEASEKVTWTAQVPFEVETRPNPELKPGEIKVVQKGVPGEKTYTADFTAKGDQATVTPEEKQTKDPVNEIIEYGPAAEDTSVVTKVEKPIPFETEIVFDDTLEEGEQVVDQQGELGTEVVTSTQKIVDGKPSGDPTVTTERTKEPKNAKIRVGTKTTGEIKKSVESEVPFGVKVEFDPNLPAGTSEVVTEGKPGKKTITVTQKVTNSQPDGEATIEEKITEKPVDQVIKVGTKPSEASEKVTWTAEVPFKVVTRPNSELKPGEIRVVQKGVPGEKTYTADFTAKGDQATVTPEEKQTKDPVNEIIEYGPAAEDTSVVTKVEKPVPFETEIVFDDSLEKGKQVVDQQGETGTEVVTSTQKIVDGKPSGDPTVTTERTKEPVKQIIRVGTKSEETKPVSTDVEWTEKTPFETEIRVNPELQPGETKVVQEGTPGEIKHIVKVTVDSNGEVSKEKSSEEISQPSPRIIEVGPAKGVETELTDKHTEEIPYDTLIEYDPKLESGKVVEDQAGKTGSKEITKTWKLVDGQPVGEPETSEEITQPKQDRKIRVGTKCDCKTPEDPKPEDPKPEDPKPEDPKPEDPKPEDPKPEDPKPEDPKPEDPKPEDPKPEDPKPEDPKPEDPKPEDPKPEDPKPEDPKPEDPKPEDPKPEDPKPEDPKDPNTPGGSSGSVTPKPNLPGIIGSLGIGGAIVGSGSHGSTPKPDPKQPGKPGNADKPGTPGKSSTPSQPGAKGSTSTGSSSSQKQVDSPRMSTLASTGANVLGVFAVGLALIIGAIPLLRRRREEGEA
ncbi:G5 domain-containing protein [Corynebacterium evansiae]|uniref:G5 domain-containing protein n=1 Tax=Corynebacterium evansiae TaxID=2913499 RepID=UPI003EB79B35